MITVTHKRSGNAFYRIVVDSENSANNATFKITATEELFKGVEQTADDTSTFDEITGDDWIALVDSFQSAIDYANEFIGGHPPHFPVPTRPK
jgi:hypothetical protein